MFLQMKFISIYFYTLIYITKISAIKLTTSCPPSEEIQNWKQVNNLGVLGINSSLLVSLEFHFSFIDLASSGQNKYLEISPAQKVNYFETMKRILHIQSSSVMATNSMEQLVPIYPALTKTPDCPNTSDRFQKC